jgi:hypothetical protein
VWLPNLLLIVSKIEASREVRKNGDTLAAVALSHTQTKRRKNLFVAGTRCPQVAFPRLALPDKRTRRACVECNSKNVGRGFAFG